MLDNSTKIAEYIAECREMGIRLLPPDVNESFADFSVSGNDIRFGLVAIKSIGRGFINELISRREEDGPFRSLEDFCRRMAGRELNRRAVETSSAPERSTAWASSARRCCAWPAS